MGDIADSYTIGIGSMWALNTLGNTAIDLVTYASMDKDPKNSFKKRLAEEFSENEGEKLHRRYELFKTRAIAAYDLARKSPEDK